MPDIEQIGRSLCEARPTLQGYRPQLAVINSCHPGCSYDRSWFEPVHSVGDEEPCHVNDERQA